MAWGFLFISVSGEAGIFIPQIARLGKIGVATKCCLCNQRGKFTVEFSWKNWCACAGKELLAHEADLGTQARV